MTIRIASVFAAVVLSTPMMTVPGFAQQQGTTSGPAVGTPVIPGTAAQKDNATNSGATSVQQGAVGVGAPGATAKPGTEGGPSPRPGTPRQ